MIDLTKLNKQQLTKHLQAMLQDSELAQGKGELQRLVHELRVHQIELEMQNRQLMETQKGLEISRDRYSELYDFSPVGYVTVTEKGSITQVNLTGAKMIGRPREQVAGQPLSIFLPKADWPHWFNYLKKVLASDVKIATELRLGKGAESYRHVYLESIAVCNEQGKPDACHCAIVDITDRKHAEVMLQQAHDELEQRVAERTQELIQTNNRLTAEIAVRERLADKLRDNEARYRLVVDSQSELICRWRRDGTLTFVNEAYCRYFEKSREQLVGQRFMSLMSQKDRADLQTHTALINKDNPVDAYEQRIVAPGGQIRWLRWTNLGTFDAEGSTIEFQSVGTDITERRQAELELQRYREHLEDNVAKRTAELQASNKELEAFSYSIAHDLRAPLRAITSFSQILLTDAAEKLDEEELTSLRRVVSAGKYMAQLIDDILHLATVSRNELKFESVDISAMCRKLAAQLNKSEPERSVTWVIADSVVVWGDEKALSIIIDNLLRNAWKFTSKTPHAVIQVGLSDEWGVKTLYVRDNGVGFEMQYAHKLFRAFERLHDAQQFEGTGIGLATVRHIVERHGGKVSAQAAPDEGATFFIFLPGREENQKNIRQRFNENTGAKVIS